MVAHQFKDGRAAAFADGWCTICFKAEPVEGLMVCQKCRERRNQNGRNRFPQATDGQRRYRRRSDVQTMFGR